MSFYSTIERREHQVPDKPRRSLGDRPLTRGGHGRMLP